MNATRSTRALAVSILVLVAASRPRTVLADTFFLARLQSFANSLDGSSVLDAPPPIETGTVPFGPLPFTLSHTLPASAAAGSASADAFNSVVGTVALPGAIGGITLRARSSATSVAPAGGQNPTSAVASGNALILYQDSLTVNGPAPGSPVLLAVTLVLDGAMTLAASTPATSTHAQLSFSDGGIPADPIEQLLCRDLNGACRRADRGTMTALAGAPRPIRLELFVQTAAHAAFNGDTFAAASADFGATSRLFVDVLTPGATYTLDSGGDLRSAAAGDANCDGAVTAADLTELVRLIASGARSPCNGDDAGRDGEVADDDLEVALALLFEPLPD